MIRSLFGPKTSIAMMKGGLEEQAATQRAIAKRVARAAQASTSDFGTVLEGAQAAEARKQAEVDLQMEMASLAETQLRYELTAKRLSSAYDSLRTAIRSNG